MLAPIETANRNGYGLTPSDTAALSAIGANNTAQAVLLMNIVRIEVVAYMPASKIIGPYPPNELTSPSETSLATPVFSIAIDIGSIPAINTTLSQLTVL